MMSVKHIWNGGERVCLAREVTYLPPKKELQLPLPAGAPFSDFEGGEVNICTENFTYTSLVGGKVYVMNDLGATICKYHLEVAAHRSPDPE